MSEGTWEARVDGAIRGPLTTETLRAMLASGQVAAATQARAIGDYQWRTVGELIPSEEGRPNASALESLRRRAGWARALLVAYVVVCVASMAIAVVMIQFFGRLEQDVAGTAEAIEAEANRIDLIAGVVGVIYMIAFLAAGVLILTWVNCSVRNARIVAPRHVTISPGWAVGWNFIPIASLWMPHRSMRQVWRASMAPEKPETVEVPGVVWLWWICWVISNLIANVSFRIYMQDDPSLDQLRRAATMDIASDALSIVSCLALSSVIARVTAAQLDWSGAPAVRRGDGWA